MIMEPLQNKRDWFKTVLHFFAELFLVLSSAYWARQGGAMTNLGGLWYCSYCTGPVSCYGYSGRRLPRPFLGVPCGPLEIPPNPVGRPVVLAALVLAEKMKGVTNGGEVKHGPMRVKCSAVPAESSLHLKIDERPPLW